MIQKHLRYCPVDPSRKRLAIIANPASFVKNFFRVFSAFFIFQFFSLYLPA